ncbi:MAG TPA: TadE/TadG family type IV pilus assembly protein [Bryobacteraceae bacterium]|nr:TadE/TadG family type IV pilus assembly protein [Bryobacteraceae bacterium]
MRKRGLHESDERGFTLVATAFGIIFLIGMVGLAVDVGRLFIAKSETQVFVDSASLAATLELDGTSDGLDRARARVASNPNQWNFNTSSFSAVTTTFATSTAGPWEANPADPSNYRFANAQVSVDVPVLFLSAFRQLNVPGAFIVLSPTFTSGVNSNAASAQELKTRFNEGVFPFSPYAHDGTSPDFRLVVGQLYTLRWAANPRLDSNTCPGDNTSTMIQLENAGGGSERGYIEDTSSAIIRQAIEDDYQTAWRGIGYPVNMTGGAKQTELDAIRVRIGQDTDSTAPDYATYDSNGTGNGRRLVGVPINTGYPDYMAVQIAAFFLPPANTYDQGGNSPWCAEYVGPWVQGSKKKGAGDSGSYVARTIQ